MASKYEPIRREIFRRLLDGVYQVGSRLPTEHQLAAEFSVNRHTLRRAIGQLVDAGYLRRTPGKGTVVTARPSLKNRRGTMRIGYWYFGKGKSTAHLRYKVTEKLIERFSRLHPEVEVIASPETISVFPLSEPSSYTLDERCPTVCRFSYFADLAHRGALLPLDGFEDILNVTMSLESRLLYETMDRAGEWHLHALPVQLATWMMITNVSVLRECQATLPDRLMTWEEFYEACRIVSERGASEDIRGLCLELTAQHQSIMRFLPYFYMASGGRTLVDGRSMKAYLDAPGNENFLELLRRLWSSQACHDDNNLDKFLSGKGAFRLSVNKESIQAARLHLPGTDFQAVPLPIPEGRSAAFTVIRGEYAGILADTVRSRREREIAWEFLKFLVSSEAQEIAFREAQDLPARTDLFPMVRAGGGLEGQFLDYALQHGLPAFDVPGNLQVHGIIQDAMLWAMTGILDPARALAEGQQRLEAHLSAVCSRSEVALEHSLFS